MKSHSGCGAICKTVSLIEIFFTFPLTYDILSLNLMITNIKRSLGDELLSKDTMESIATSMGILATAKSSLQRLLHGKLNLGYQIGQLTTKIDNALKPILTRIFESTTKKDFVMAAVSEHQATIFGQHLEKYVKAGSKKRLRSAKDKFKQALQGAPTLVDEFFNSSFEKNRMDSTPLRRLSQNCSISSAPGKRPAMPTMANAPGLSVEIPHAGATSPANAVPRAAPMKRLGMNSLPNPPAPRVSEEATSL